MLTRPFSAPRSSSIPRFSESLILKRNKWNLADWEKMLIATQASTDLVSLRLIGKLPKGITDTISILFNKQLEYLELVNAQLSAEDAWKFSPSIASNPTLLVLNLNGSFLGNEGVIHIANALAQNSVIQHVSLGHNNIEDGGLKALGKCLVLNKTLKTLVLCNNRFSETGIFDFAQALELSHLEGIDLCGMDISCKASTRLQNAKRVASKLEFIWLDSVDLDSQEHVMKKLLLQEERLTQLFQEIQTSTTSDRALAYHVENLQIINFDKCLDTENCVKSVLNLGTLPSQKLKEGCVQTKLTKKETQYDQQFIFEHVPRPCFSRNHFCYKALYRILQNPMIRQELLINMSTKLMTVTEKPPNNSLRMSQAVRESYSVEFNEESTQLYNKGKRRSSSHNNDRDTAITDKSPIRFFKSVKNKTRRTRLRSRGSSAVSTSSWKSQASVKPVLQQELSKQQVETKYKFSKKQFQKQYRELSTGGHYVNIYYGSQVLPFQNIIIKGNLTLVIIFPYSEFVLNSSALQEKILQSVRFFYRNNKNMLQIMFILRDMPEKGDNMDLNRFLKSIQQELRVKVIKNRNLSYYNYQDSTQQIQETVAAAIMCKNQKDYDFFDTNILNYKSVDSFLTLEAYARENNQYFPIEKIKHVKELKQFKQVGLTMYKKYLVVLSPIWLFKIIKLLFDDNAILKTLEESSIDQTAIEQYKTNGILTKDLLMYLVTQATQCNPTSREKRLLLELFEDFNILSLHYFSTSLRNSEQFNFLLKPPLCLKNQADHKLEYKFIFNYAQSIPLYFYELFITLIISRFNNAMMYLRVEASKLPKNMKRKCFIKQLNENSLDRLDDTTFEITNKDIKLKLKKTSDTAISISTDNRDNLIKLYKLVLYCLKSVNIEYYQNTCELNDVQFSSENQWPTNVKDLIKRRLFPFDFVGLKQQQMSLNELTKRKAHTEQRTDVTEFIKELLLPRKV